MDRKTGHFRASRGEGGVCVQTVEELLIRVGPGSIADVLPGASASTAFRPLVHRFVHKQRTAGIPGLRSACA